MPKVIATYRKTSRLSMRIGQHGEVRVSAPHGLTKEDVERFINEHREWIDKALERTRERLEKRNEFYEQLPLETRAERREAVEQLRAIVWPLMEKYAPLMGVQPSTVSFRATISKWGSCTVRNRSIQLSIYLLLLPEWCIEHVVVHELAHLIVPNHSPKFYAVMDKFFPRWQEARQETKRISRMETEE